MSIGIVGGSLVGFMCGSALGEVARECILETGAVEGPMGCMRRAAAAMPCGGVIGGGLCGCIAGGAAGIAFEKGAAFSNH